MRRFVASVSALALSMGVVLVPHAFAQAKPSLSVVSPSNGETVTSTDIPVSVQVSNFTLSPADVGMPDKPMLHEPSAVVRWAANFVLNEELKNEMFRQARIG